MNTIVARPVAAQRRTAGQRHALVAVSHMRLMMLLLLFAAAVLLVVGRLMMLALTAEGDRVGNALLASPRGDIVDRNGEPLARTIDAWTIGVHPKKLLGDPMEVAQKLAELMPERGDRYHYHRLLTSGVNFTYLQRRASPALVEAVNAIGEPAIVFERETQRLYPQSTMAAHALGFLSTDGKGMSGMERVLDEQLTNPALNGKPVALSIDMRVQAAMESELSRAMLSMQARGAAGLVLDVDTGEIVSMVSLPVFNPNRVGMASTEELRNNTVQSVYELGSTFKVLTAAVALETGVASLSRRFDATAPLQVGRFRIKDDHAQNRWMNIPETLVHSSNIATARMADEIGPQRMQAMFRRLGFDTKPDVELREKGRPLWPGFWARTTTMTTAYGHGIAVTPLHLASAYAAMINGGVWRPSTLLKVERGRAPKGRRVISEATSHRMRQMMRLIVQEGTGKKGEAPGYRVGGKTGTAEVAQGGGYASNANVSTFAAAFPMDAPRYVVIAMMDSPKRVEANQFQTTAAYTAAPVVSRVISRTGALLGVIPDDHRDVDQSDVMPLLWRAPGEKAGH